MTKADEEQWVDATFYQDEIKLTLLADDIITIRSSDLENRIATEKAKAVQQFADEVKGKIGGLEIDVEATTKHIESYDFTGDELAQRLLDMEIEADDRKDVLDDCRAAIDEALEQYN